MKSEQKQWKDSYWIHSGFYSLTDKVLLLAFGFITIILLLRGLSQYEFGIWVLFSTAVAVVEVARIGWLQNGLIHYLVSSPSFEKRKLVSMGWLMEFCFALFVILVIMSFASLVATFYGSDDLGDILKLYAFTAMALVPFFVSQYLMHANLNFKGLMISNLIRKGSFCAAIGTAFLIEGQFTLVQLAILQIFTTVLASVFAVWLAQRYFPKGFEISLGWFGKLFRFGRLVFGTNLTGMLSRSMDKFMLGYITNPVSLAVYEVAIKISNIGEIPTQGMTSILYPKAASIDKISGKEISDLYVKSVTGVLLAVIPFVLIVFTLADTFVLWIAGSEYSSSAALLRITIFITLYIPFINLFGNLLDALGRPHHNLIFSSINLILNVTFLFIGIKLAGYFGAAIGIVCAMTIAAIISQIYMVKSFGMQISAYLHYFVQNWKKFVIPPLRGIFHGKGRQFFQRNNEEEDPANKQTPG